MPDKVLWEIDNELDWRNFERLCVALLHRNGFLDIVPIEPQDGGRDAEERPRVGRAGEGHPALFQFSMERNWKSKLRSDAKKLQARAEEFDTYVFVTNRIARGVDTDLLRTEFRERYGWNLVVYSREWLRFQLEEVHSDLAAKYLAVEMRNSGSELAGIIDIDDKIEEQLKRLKAAVDKGNFDLGIAELKRFLGTHPSSYQAHQLLAWCYYRLDRFDEALSAVNRAVKFGGDNQTAPVKACILAEKGIKENNKSSLLAALRLLEKLRNDERRVSWQLFYNLGNVLAALGDHEKAIHYYLVAVEKDPKQPTIWKNLGSSHRAIGDHDKEMSCLNRALELDPQQPEALVGKAMNLLSDFGKNEEAIRLFEFALRLSPEIAVKWPHIWYWMAIGHKEMQNLQEALRCVEQGLEQQPGDRATRHLKSVLLQKLALQNSEYQKQAILFWRAELAAEPLNYDVRRQLVHALADHQSNEAWRLVDESFKLVNINESSSLRPLGFDPLRSIEALHYLPEYARFRKECPFSSYRDSQDPLNLQKVEPPIDSRLDAQLVSYFALTFGLGWHSFATSRSLQTDPKELVRLFDEMRSNILISVTQGSKVLAGRIAEQRGNAETVAACLSNALLFLTTVALREFALQRGVLMREHNVSHVARDAAMVEYDENKLNTDVFGAILSAINREVHLFRD
jgi:tetratricopeptide (TPR) repeat protein